MPLPPKYPKRKKLFIYYKYYNVQKINSKILNKLDLINNEIYRNKNIGGGNFFCKCISQFFKMKKHIIYIIERLYLN